MVKLILETVPILERCVKEALWLTVKNGKPLLLCFPHYTQLPHTSHIYIQVSQSCVQLEELKSQVCPHSDCKELTNLEFSDS